MAKRLLAFISAPFISISSDICVDAGSSTRPPGDCFVSSPRLSHARVRRRRKPDAKRFDATLTWERHLLCGLHKGAPGSLPAVRPGYPGPASDLSKDPCRTTRRLIAQT